VVLICGLIIYVLLQSRHERINKTLPCGSWSPGQVYTKTPKLYSKSTGIAVRPSVSANYTALAKSAPGAAHLQRHNSERASHRGTVWQPNVSERRPQPGQLARESIRRDSYRFSAVKSLTRSASSAHTISSTLPSTARYCDLASTKKRAFEASLNCSRSDSRDWRGLAKELGFEDITKFEELGKERYGPTRHLLNDWSKREASNVSDLVAALFKIGRHDSAYIVDSTCIRKHSTMPTGYNIV